MAVGGDPTAPQSGIETGHQDMVHNTTFDYYGAENEWPQAQVFQEHESSVNSICCAPHELGLSLACGSSDGTISVLTAKDGSWDRAKIEKAHAVGVLQYHGHLHLDLDLLLEEEKG